MVRITSVLVWMLVAVTSTAARAANGTAAPFETATFAAGCFWGTEEFFRKLPGVVETQVGYTGGTGRADYEHVSSGKTGHAESLEVRFDPAKISYDELLGWFFKMHDPTTLNRQGNDVGTQYRSAIFTHSAAQKKAADAFKAKVERSGAWGKPITTQIAPAGVFYRAEAEHQKYLQRNPGGYDNHYLRKLDFERMPAAASDLPSDAELKKKLSPMQYAVTQKADTEPAFRNEYWNHHSAGIYVDVVSGEPLFASTDKFDSGTGWPSFTRPLVTDNVVTKTDRSILLGDRTEVRSKRANSHLGHVFDDGPKPTGLRYCINSAALRFVPADRLAQEGYGEFASRFKTGK